MPFEYQFFPQHHLFYRQVVGDNLEAVRQQQAEDIEFLSQVEMPVHMVIDARFAGWRPMTLNEMKGSLAPIESSKLLWMVVVVSSDVVQKFLISANLQIANKSGRSKLTDSLEEAFAFLEERDSTLTNLRDLIPELEKQHASSS